MPEGSRPRVRLRDMIATMHRMNAALYTDELRMHEMVSAR